MIKSFFVLVLTAFSVFALTGCQASGKNAATSKPTPGALTGPQDTPTFTVHWPRNLIVYLRPIHGPEFFYLDCVSHILDSKFISADTNILVVLWPNDANEARESPKIMSGAEIFSNRDKFMSLLNSRRGTPNPDGFIAGLDRCALLAQRDKAPEILVVGYSMTGALDASEIAKLREISTRKTVDLISVEESSSRFDEWRDIVSGFMACVVEPRLPAAIESGSRLQALMVNPQSDDQTVVRAYDRLDSAKIDEDPSIWVRAAANPHLSKFARGLSFQALFRRFTNPPTSLNAFVRKYRLQTVKGEISDQNKYAGGIPFDVEDLVDKTGESRGMDLWSPGLTAEDRELGVELLISRYIPVEELTAISQDKDGPSVDIIKVRTLDGIEVKKRWGFDD